MTLTQPVFSKTLWACAFALSFTACSASKSSAPLDASEPQFCEASGKSFGIVGGETLAPNNELSTSTVMVLSLKGKDDATICTGTLIDKNLVLTAAHCTAPGGKVAIAFTNSATCLVQAPKRTVRQVIDQAIHPDYSYSAANLKDSSSDLAVLKFAGEAPAEYKVRALPSATFEVSANDTLVLSGYGTTKEKGEDSGTLRFTSVPAQRLLKEFYFGLEKKTISVPGTWTVEQNNQGVCSGDSGGPLYAHDGTQLTLIGITSMGVDHKAVSADHVKVCHGVALFVDIRSQLDWILKQMQSL